jgi:quercetin dioxygenase-like cupin family protein
MNQDVFLDRLQKEDFPAPVVATRQPPFFLDLHSHPYEAKALVLDGQIDINVGGIKTIYLAGDVFHLLANQVHTENCGSKGVQYLVSRKAPITAEEPVIENSDT